MKKFLGAFLIVTISCILSRLSFFKPNIELSHRVSYSLEKTEVISVVSYNIHHGSDGDNNPRLREMGMLLNNADIIFLAEVDRTFDRRSLFQDQVATLKKLTGLNYHAYAPTLERFNLLGLKGSYGIAILSRFPIIKKEIYYLPTQPFNEPRAALFVTIKWHNEELKILGLHLSPNPFDNNKQIDYLTGSLLDADLVLGDFNARPSELQELKQTLSLESADNKATFPANNPSAQIDYIFYGRRLKLENAQTVNTLYSDHLPVKASFSINK